VSAVTIRRAGPADARDIADMLSRVLASADTSAIRGPVEAGTIRGWMAAAPARSNWLVAEDATGAVLGLQWIEPHAGLPDAAANIATFVLPGRQQLGIGSALFTATERAGRDLGYVWINATIRADNEGGLVYYQSRGFRIWKRETGVEIAPGRVVDRLCTRYDLD
jgi:GNAT superfamily N-acetyltransferase